MSRSKTSSNSYGNDRKIVVLTAPSGSGKTSIGHRLVAAMPSLRFSVSATTRARRPHERDGVDYHFVTATEFDRLREQGELLEFEEVYPGRLYGTLRSEVERSAEEGPVLLDIDVKGAMTVKKVFPEESFAVFILPPSLQELESRLRNRGSEDEESVRDRMERARHELEYEDRFDAVVVNDDLDRAVAETLDRVRSFLQAPTPARKRDPTPDGKGDSQGKGTKSAEERSR